MNNSSRRLLTALLFVVLSFTAANVEARSPRAREWCGVLEQLNSEQRSLNVRSSKENKPLEVLWTKDTRFIHNGKFDSSSALKGTKVCVYYHSPFFGRRFASKVVWENGDSKK